MAKKGAKFSVETVDRGYNALMAELRALKGGKVFVKAGVLGSAATETHEGGMTNVQLAVIHEFGAPSANIPERSFLRSTSDLMRVQWLASFKRLLRAQAKTKNLNVHVALNKALGLVGLMMVRDIKKRVMSGDGIPPPNTPEVFMRKLRKNERGFNKTGNAPRTLIDTGRMIGSITHAVVTNGDDNG